MSPSDFENTAEHCTRWQSRSLGVVRALLVDGKALSVAAAEYEMTAQQANLHRTRFLERAEKVRVKEFMSRIKPESTTLAALKPHAQALRSLHDQGYTFAQLIKYLDEHEVKATTTTVRKFLKGCEA